MVTKYDIIRAYEKAEKENRKVAMYLNEDRTKFYDSETNEYVCSIDTYLAAMKKKLHCDFECLYHEHASLTTIYRCNDCGAVIFTGDDERYDPNLKCPVCGEYKHRGEYWSKEEIDSDPEKQKAVESFILYQKEMNEEYERRKKRGGLYDWQVFVKKWRGKKHYVCIELQNWGHKYSGTPWYKAMVDLKIDIGEKNDDFGYTIKKFYSIPLSPYSFYIKFIYRYSKKCSPDLRKYYPWQKKSKNNE